MAGISADQHEQARRAAKARQRAAAHARSANRDKTVQPLNLVELVREKRVSDRRRVAAVAAGEQNGKQLLEAARGQKLFILDSEKASSIEVWKRDVNDVIKAAKASDNYWHWNPDWLTQGRFMMSIIPGKKKRAA